ncbi:MAG: hypothetical protein IT514_05025 [Burkholderiales bacterium]|nr:hypothetical protein [Burkholderiales bacterium]
MSDVRTEKPRLIADERLRELARDDWPMRFRARYPRVGELEAGIENDCLLEAIDVHVHAEPCSLAARNQDYTQLAIEAARAGMRALVKKDHHYSTVPEAQAVQRHIDHLVDSGLLARRVEVYGGVPLSFSLDSAQITQSLRFSSFKMIWCNPIDGEPLVRDGKVRPEAERIIALAREHGVALTLGVPGHSRKKYGGIDDYDGLMPLVERVAALGAAAVLDHPLSSFTIDQIERLAVGGIYAGLFCYPSLPSVIKAPVVDPERTRELVNRLGPQRCIVASDVGMLLEPTALEAFRLMIRLLLALGFGKEDLALMLKTNPAKLIGLKP